MTGEPRAYFSGRAAVFAVALGALIGAAQPAAAWPETLREGLFGQRPEGRQFSTPPVARYVCEDGDAFTLDRRQHKPLLKCENSVEVYALQPQPGPRGDIIYKNDIGEPILRATRLGGVTVFTDQRPGGSAA